MIFGVKNLKMAIRWTLAVVEGHAAPLGSVEVSARLIVTSAKVPARRTQPWFRRDELERCRLNVRALNKMETS